MILQDEQTGFWCHTLLIENPSKIRFRYKGKIRYGREFSIIFHNYICGMLKGILYWYQEDEKKLFQKAS